jgi:hypothetical protein
MPSVRSTFDSPPTKIDGNAPIVDRGIGIAARVQKTDLGIGACVYHANAIESLELKTNIFVNFVRDADILGKSLIDCVPHQKSTILLKSSAVTKRDSSLSTSSR